MGQEPLAIQSPLCCGVSVVTVPLSMGLHLAPIVSLAALIYCLGVPEPGSSRGLWGRGPAHKQAQDVSTIGTEAGGCIKAALLLSSACLIAPLGLAPAALGAGGGKWKGKRQ